MGELKPMQSTLPSRRPDQVFIIQVKIGQKPYYLVDLQSTISRNRLDAMVFVDAKTAHAVERTSEASLERGLGVPVTCTAEAVDKDIVTGG